MNLASLRKPNVIFWIKECSIETESTIRWILIVLFSTNHTADTLVCYYKKWLNKCTAGLTNELRKLDSFELKLDSRVGWPDSF